jgi:glycosyltransferase involved in cell wall biosynthesis
MTRLRAALCFSGMRISIVIPAFNEERLLGETLLHVRRAMAAFERRGWETELIVCNNNSTDRTAEVAREGGATVVFEPVNQIGRARNTGAAAATGEWIVFVDADSLPSEALMGEVADQIGSGVTLAGGCTIRLQGNHLTAAWVTGFWNFVSRWRRLLAGSFIFVETAAFREIGGFSRDFFAGEELDLAQRLHELARRRNRRIVVLHRHPIVTSDRKVRLYTGWEHLRFMLRAGFRPGATMRNRHACHAWYDGRR